MLRFENTEKKKGKDSNPNPRKFPKSRNSRKPRGLTWLRRLAGIRVDARRHRAGSLVRGLRAAERTATGPLGGAASTLGRARAPTRGRTGGDAGQPRSLSYSLSPATVEQGEGSGGGQSRERRRRRGASRVRSELRTRGGETE